MRPALTQEGGYQPEVVEKVERLLELLSELNAHPYLAPRLLLHGGTALNVFHLSMPRLSVDADLTYVGHISREDFERERRDVEDAVWRLAESLGYQVTTSSKTQHAGRTMKLRYGSGEGRDLIKLDLIYLNRAPLLPAEQAACQTCSPQVTVSTLALPELVAGKTKALFDRVAVRDLYDVHRIQTSNVPLDMAMGDDSLYGLQRRVRLYYISLSKPFPCEISSAAAAKFRDRAHDVADELIPVLHTDDRPRLEEMIENVSTYIADHVAPKDDNEFEYLRLLGEESRYRPELLFEEWPEVLEQARLSPAAEWKVRNLANRPEPSDSDYPGW